MRDRFRTVQDGSLATRACEGCKGLVYVVPNGQWLHWATLGEACPVADPPSGLCNGQEEAISGLVDSSTGGKVS